MGKENKPYRLGLYEKSMPSNLCWKEKLFFTKQSGFDYLEISIDESDEKLKRLDYTVCERDEICKAIKETGIPIDSMCLSGHRKYPLGSHDENIRKEALCIMEKAIDFSAYIGIRIIQLAGYDVYYEEGDEQTKQYFEENLKKCVLMAARKGVCLGFETMETSFMDTVEKAMEYVAKIKNPYLGIYPDIGNLKNSSILYQGDVNKDLCIGNGHIFASHLKETRPGEYREVPFGSGHTDFELNIETLATLGVRMFVGEFWYTGNQNWRDDVLYANQFLRKHLNCVFQS